MEILEKLNNGLPQLKGKTYYDLYEKKIKEIDLDVLHPSEIHGFKHNLRVLTLGLFLAERLELDEIDTNILFDGCIYHDIGRINDEEDLYHGERGSIIVRHLINYDDELSMKILKKMLITHSLDDKFMDRILNVFDGEDFDRAKKLCLMLKDCDGLDRIRNNDFKKNYLRYRQSVDMIDLEHYLLKLVK